ncbi:YqcI/YcgG family protein [Halobaculum sp. MBLA0143]|uniref:YqcI/YcgG family protein n=1 Tax=Halobaculum sp. MBLA0143 TaxID=3079933 RepID=UPI003526AAA4
MNEPGVQALVDQTTFRERVESGDYPDWARDHWESFYEGLTGERDGEPFPCFFGAESVAAGDPLYTVVPSTTDPDALLGLRDTLREYLRVWDDHSQRASLVTFFRPPEESLSEAAYHERLWHVLQFLHVHDPEPWPEEIPTDPDDPYWEFCFDDEPIFPTCRAPFYDDRMSRYCPVGLEITFQPRALFETMGVTADTEAGERARDTIQDRLVDYDGVCPHADLGDWGTEGDREWLQYMLESNPEQSPDECPIHVTRDHPKVSPAVDPVAGGGSS